jgi:hypothetical protein
MMDSNRRSSHHLALKKMKRPLAILSILLIAALTMGMALAERMEQRAQQDRLLFGDTVDRAAQ